MCTALTLKTKNTYFGRTLDLDRSYGEEVVIMPKNHKITFSKMGELNSHYAIIGMAMVVNGIPLFYDGANEKGLAMAGLNFPLNAYYAPVCEGKDNVAQYEFITYILSKCASVLEVKEILKNLNLTNLPFSEKLPPSPLHYIISDKNSSIVLEYMKEGLRLFDNPRGILTNNPPLFEQLKNLENYKGLRNDNKEVKKNKNLGFSDYCQGLGAVGLPGDVSSKSRFVRLAFNKKHSVCENDELSSVSQFFHLLTSVEMLKGACVTDENTFDFTVYTSCINLEEGKYYYSTYNNRQITCISMNKENLNGSEIIRFKLNVNENVKYEN